MANMSDLGILFCNPCYHWAVGGSFLGPDRVQTGFGRLAAFCGLIDGLAKGRFTTQSGHEGFTLDGVINRAAWPRVRSNLNETGRLSPRDLYPINTPSPEIGESKYEQLY